MDHSSDTTPTDTLATEGQDSLTSKSLNRRHVIMGCAMLAVSGLCVARAPKRRFEPMTDKQFEALFPKNFANWRLQPTSEMILPPESELANKLYEHILTRSYQNSKGDVVMFLAAFSSVQIEDVQLHRPEVCYRVAGFQITENNPYDLKIDAGRTVPARIILAERPLRTETIVYWTRVGSEFPLGWSGQRWSMAKANLEGYYPDGILIRASVAETGNNDVELLSQFYRDLDQHSSAAAKRLLYNA